MDVLSTFGLFVVQLHLVKSECGPAPVVQNGTAEGTGFQHGNSRKYTCDLGFRLSDFHTSICTSEDEWSPAPSCKRISCGNPPAVANSHISRKTGARYTDQQTYACNSGYILNGTATIICGVNGWSEPLPVCDKISCSTPPSILNGQFILNSTLYLDIVNYTCDNGYELGEVTEITCQADGSWSTLPSCDRVSCGSAPVLQNGIIDVSIGTLYTDTVKYKCDLGYIINGQDTVTCQGDKSWTIMPTCDIRQCGTPPAVQNADWTNTGISYLDEATYTCKTGYEFSDSESRITITCLHTGSWETEPSCSVVDCGEPPSIVNADVSGTGTVYQATRQIECHSGFITHGIAFVMCTSNSSWSTSPVCYKQCLSEPSVTNATSTGSGMEYLDIRTFQCSYGYIMTGMPTVSCQEDGTWTTLPICKIVRCGTPKAITDGTLSGTGTDYGDVRIVSCNTGYSLTGNTSITCEATGIWTVLPTCSRKDCGAPPTVSNSLYNVSGTFYGDNLKFVCDEGYNLIGADTVMCDADAEWTATPTCQKKDCGNYPFVNDSSVSGKGTLFQDIANYVCNPGYVMEGSANVTCQSDGSWTNAPNCHRKTCGKIPAVNYSSSFVTGNKFMDFTTYTCADGYTLTWPTYLTCNTEGVWSAIPICENVYCNDAPVIENGVTEGSGNHLGANRTYKCNAGYELYGPTFIQCKYDGTWSGNSYCIKKTEPVYILPKDSVFDITWGTINATTAKELRAKLNTIERLLKLDKKLLTLYKRKHISVYEKRAASISLGAVISAGSIMIFAIAIVIPDVSRIWNDLNGAKQQTGRLQD